MLPSLPPCYFLGDLGWQLLDQYFLVLFICFLSPSLPRFAHHVHSSSGFCCAYSPFLHRLRLVLAPVPVPVLHFIVRIYPVLVPAPVLSTSTFTSPFSPPTPLPSPFQPSTPILPPTPHTLSRPSDPVTPSVRCTCTDSSLCVCV